jgi:hypothetical protein
MPDQDLIKDFTDRIGYIFNPGAKPDEPMSYQSLLMRRKIAEAIMSKRLPFPQDIGQGLTYLGEKIADRRLLDQADAAGRAVDKREDALMGGGGPLAIPSVAGTAPAVASEERLPAAASAVANPSSPPAPLPQRGGNLTDPGRSMEPVPITPALNPSVDRFGRPNVVPPSNLGTRSQLSPEQISSIADASQPRPAAQLSPGQIEGIAGSNPLRNRIAAATLARQGVVPPDPTAAAAGPVASEASTATGEEGDNPLTTMAQAESSLNPMIPAPDIRTLPPREGSVPELEPIPGPRDLTVPLAGDRPVRPSPIGPSKRMLDLIPYMNAQKYSPQITQRAEQLYKLEENRNKAVEERQQKDFEHDFAIWNQKREKQEQRTFDVPKTQLENQQARLNILKSQLDAAKNPLEIAKLQNEITEGEQKIAAGVRDTVEGRIIRYDAKGNPVDITPKQAPEDIKLPAESQKALELYQMGRYATRGMGDAAILASGPQRVLGGVPIFGNALVKEKYQLEQSRANAWVQAFLRHESGATIRPDETKDYIPTYFPVFGDSKAQIAEKLARRQNREQSSYESLGVARPLADKFHERIGFAHGKAEGARQVNSDTGKIRKVVNGYWVEEK